MCKPIALPYASAEPSLADAAIRVASPVILLWVDVLLLGVVSDVDWCDSVLALMPDLESVVDEAE